MENDSNYYDAYHLVNDAQPPPKILWNKVYINTLINYINYILTTQLHSEETNYLVLPTGASGKK